MEEGVVMVDVVDVFVVFASSKELEKTKSVVDVFVVFASSKELEKTKSV